MKYTKEQLHGMSDFDVNRALAISQSKYVGAVGDWMPNGVKVSDEFGFFYSEVDYCNTPNDIMPLAFECGISIVCQHDTWDAFLYGDASYPYQFVDKNPLRAIACCLILVLQGEKE